MKILYLFPSPVEQMYKSILAGDIPSDRLYGLIELQRLGYNVSYMDVRPQRHLKKLIEYINKKFGFNIIDLKAFLILWKYDVIVVKNYFTTALTIACRLLNKKIVYADALFTIPQNKIKKLLYKINIQLSSGIVVYSNRQAELWSELFDIPTSRFKVISYTIDVPFYQNIQSNKASSEPFVLSVGRDMARDYKTLVEAMDGIGIKLKIVSLPYLLKDVILDSPDLEILESISYERLFKLYADALIVVIPLKKWGVIYPSGIRGLLEAKILGKGVIASHSPLLEEYLSEEEGVTYVEPENVIELRNVIMFLLEKPDEILSLEVKGSNEVESKYNMDVFAQGLGNYLTDLFNDSSRLSNKLE